MADGDTLFPFVVIGINGGGRPQPWAYVTRSKNTPQNSSEDSPVWCVQLGGGGGAPASWGHSAGCDWVGGRRPVLASWLHSCLSLWPAGRTGPLRAQCHLL